MKKNKDNRQFQETHERLMNTLITLLSEQPGEKITVTKICTAMSVNRSTFYEHFTDLYDLMEQTEISISKEASACFLEGLASSRRDAFLHFFIYVKKHQPFYLLYLSHGKTIHFPKEMLGEDMEERRRNISDLRWGHPVSNEDYHMDFFRAGINAVIYRWVQGGCTEAPEEIYQILLEEYRPFPTEVTKRY